MGSTMKPTLKKVICIKSGSKFYKQKGVYTVYKDLNGYKYVKGSDGLFDNLSKTVSKFVDYEK